MRPRYRLLGQNRIEHLKAKIDRLDLAATVIRCCIEQKRISILPDKFLAERFLYSHKVGDPFLGTVRLERSCLPLISIGRRVHEERFARHYRELFVWLKANVIGGNQLLSIFISPFQDLSRTIFKGTLVALCSPNALNARFLIQLREST